MGRLVQLKFAEEVMIGEKDDERYFHPGFHTTEEIMRRLENLHSALEYEGWYVKANTVFLAIDRLRELRALQFPSFNPDDLPTQIPEENERLNPIAELQLKRFGNGYKGP